MPLTLRATPSVFIEPAGEQDIAHLASLHQGLHRLHVESEPEVYRPVDVPTMVHWFAEQLARDGWFAELARDEPGGDPVGYSVFEMQTRSPTPLTRARRVLLVHQLYVVETHRERGVGGRLMSSLEERARAGRVEVVELQVRGSNLAAMRFYEARGFGPVSHRLARATET